VTINEAVTAIEKAVKSMTEIVASQVRPSGDDVDVIKVWVDLGSAKIETVAWKKTFEDALRALVPGAAPYRIEVHAETGA
jgi:hypothetical protein